MSFFLISDTHVNTWSVLPELIVESDYALLAGDIGDPYHESYVNYLIKVSKKYKLVFLITGNHEYDNYNGDLNKFEIIDDLIKHHIKTLEKNHNITNIIFLQKKSYEHDQFRILGCTLWSKMTEDGHKSVNGFGMFKNFLECQEKHNEHLEWLLDEIPKSNKPTIILVHFGPLKQMSGNFINLIDGQSAFVTELPELFQKPVVAVCSGHVHSNVITKYNEIYSISNALGYPNENQEIVKYNPNLKLSII